MNARKVLMMGGGTLLVSLPKEWTRKNGISKGSTVAVDELSERKLIIRPIEDVTNKPREAMVEYPREDFTHVLNDVTGAYLMGYDTIRIQGSKVINRVDRERLKATIGRLIGLEIMDEDSKHVTIQFLLEPSSVNPEKMVRRMSSIIEGMVKDTAEAIAKSDPKLFSLVTERDDEVDRLYFLLVRSIRTATMNLEVAEGYGLTAVDVLDYRVLASFLESEGDAIAELSKRMHGLSIPRQIGLEYVAILGLLNKMEDLAIQAFLNRRSGRSRTMYLKIGELSRLVSDSLARISQHSEVRTSPAVETLAALERMGKLLVDISDLAVPTQSQP